MKKLLLFLTCILTLGMLANAQDGKYSWTIQGTESVNNNMTTLTLGDITWNVDWVSVGGNNGQRDGKNGLRFGAKNNPLTHLYLSSNYFAGKTIKSISVNAKKPSKAQTTFVAKIGETAVGNPIDIQTSYNDYTFSNLNVVVPADKDLILAFENSNQNKENNNGGLTLASITIEYTTAAAAVAAPELIMAKQDGKYLVTMTCVTDGASIYYTTDESEPTAESTAYTAPVEVQATTTFKAIAVKGTDKSTVTNFVAEIPTLGALTVTMPDGTVAEDDGTYTIYQGQTISATAANAESIQIIALDEAGEYVANTTTDGATASWTAENIASEMTFEITAKLDNDEKAVMFTLNVVEMPKPENYVLVSSTDELVEGVTYIIAGDSSKQDAFSLMSNDIIVNDADKYFKAIKSAEAETYGYAKNDNIVTLSYIEGANAGKIAMVTLEGNSTDGFKIKNQNNQYIQITATSSNHKMALTEDATKATVFAISIDQDGKYTIQVSGETTGSNVFTYNAQSPRFSNYKTSQGQIYLYAKVGKPEMPKPIVEDGVTITETAEGWSVVPTTYPVTLTFTVDENTDIYHMDVTPGAEPAAAPAKEGDGHTILTENTLVLKAPGEVHSVYAMKHGVQSDKKMITAEVPTGIKGISETTTPVQYFNLQGVRIDKPAKGGIYIKVQGKNTSKIVF